MRITSKLGGTWEISADNIRPQVWEAIHSSFEPDGDSPRFHQRASADTLEELYVAIAEVEDDAVETVREHDGRHMDPAQVDMVRALLADCGHLSAIRVRTAPAVLPWNRPVSPLNFPAVCPDCAAEGN